MAPVKRTRRQRARRVRLLGSPLPLLLVSALAGLGMGPGSPVAADAAPCAGPPKRVVIVGAGIAGAAAAQNITASDPCFNVTVLEARDRVGGRMYSRTGTVPGLGEVRAELGGQWIHGYPKNPLVKLAEKFNLTLGFEVDNYIHFASTGRRYTERQLSTAGDEYEVLREDVLAYADRQEEDLSVDAAFRAYDEESYLKPYAQNQVAVDFDFDYASCNNLSAWYYESDYFGPDDALVLDGYDNIPKGLMKEAQDKGAQLILGFQVTDINRNPDGTLIVTGALINGGTSQSFEADAVLLTVPLGVLKAEDIKFSPPLSANKSGAIERLGFGTGTKVAMFYETVFWDTSSNDYGIEDSVLPANRGRFPFWRSLVNPEGMNALMGYSVGDYAVRMSGNASGLVEDAKAKVAAMFPGGAGNPVLEAWVQDWLGEPFSLGMYSFAKVGVQGNGTVTTDWATMAAPEPGNLFFAGEHTNAQYVGTVHGAYLSGLREAQNILSIKTNSSAPDASVPGPPSSSGAGTPGSPPSPQGGGGVPPPPGGKGARESTSHGGTWKMLSALFLMALVLGS